MAANESSARLDLRLLASTLVHEDMKYRFAQTQQIGERLTLEATRTLAASVEGHLEAGELRVAVFNPLPTPYEGVVDLQLVAPFGWPSFNTNMGVFEPTPTFRIFAANGEEVAYQRLSQTMNRTHFRTYGVAFPRIQGERTARGPQL